MTNKIEVAVNSIRLEENSDTPIMILSDPLSNKVLPIWIGTIEAVNGEISLTARPSDAIALALRSEAPITVNKDVFEANSIDLIKDKSEDIEEFKEFIDNITPDDFL